MKPYYYDRVQFGGPTHPRRRHPLLWALVAAAVLVLAALFTPAAARAGEADTIVWGTCPNLAQWGPNSDETDRQPVATADGVQFSGTQLMHHPVDLALADLKPGTYEATPEPDQPSFFSVEVGDSTTNGYATLRWNTGTHVWDAVIKGTLVSHADPADFLGAETKWGTLTAGHTRVFTFGIGYTQNPPGTVTTVVDAVQFQGQTYSLTCKPAPVSSSASPKPSRTTTSPKPHGSTTAAGGAVAGGSDGGTGALAITGPPVYLLVIWALGLAGLGLVAVLLVWRRKTRFTA